MSEQVTDQLLIKRVQEGDGRAFNLLVIRYQHKVAALLSRYITQSDIADVAQETFIKAYYALPTFRSESAFYTWLYRIAVNTAKNHLTAQGRRPIAEVDIQKEEDQPYLDKLQEISNPENLMLSEELGKVLIQSIENLSEELRVAITLREFEGLSYDEIAVIMDCPVGTVRSRIFRAREVLDKKIQSLG